MPHDPDIVVIGGGPNGLVAANHLAGAGLDVLLLEANDALGGAARSDATTLPGFIHDGYSAFYPLAAVGPLGELPLAEHGLTWLRSTRPYGGGTVDGPGVAQESDLEASARLFEAAHAGDGAGWRELFGFWEWGGPAFLEALFNPIGDPRPLAQGARLLRSPQRLLEFGQMMVGPVAAMSERFFRGDDARVWLIGSTLHGDFIPEDAAGGAFALALSGLGQQVGMPVPRGGAGTITEALSRLLHARGGRALAGQRAERIIVRDGRAVAVRTATDEYRARRAILATSQPKALFLDLVGAGHLPAGFVKLVHRFRWGTGNFVLNCALSARPRFKSEVLDSTLVLHLGRDPDELSRAAIAVRRDVIPENPFLVAGVHTLVDPTRAPEGRHTLWMETHVSARIADDQAGTITARNWEEARAPFAERMLATLEQWAPGVRQLVMAMHARTPDDLEASNANLVGGDNGCGTHAIDQQLVFRPFPGWFRHKTPIDGLYIGGASTHPGGGVSGAPGANAARVILGDLRLVRAGERVRARLDGLLARLR